MGIFNIEQTEISTRLGCHEQLRLQQHILQITAQVGRCPDMVPKWTNFSTNGNNGCTAPDPSCYPENS